jgi:FkbM family methyltransferase
MIGAVAGGVVQRLPRGRNRIATLLQRRWPRVVSGRDATGLLRTFDLADLLQAQWFCGVPVGLSDEALALVREGDWVVDVGANVGIVTGQLSRAVGSSGRVTALEPVPANVARLQALKERNTLTQLDIQVLAAGARTGTETLKLPPEGNSGWASFSASWLDSGTLEVVVRPLDELIPELAAGTTRRVALMKIDVEGYEFEVLEGAAAVLAEHRPALVLELNDPLLRDRGRSSADLLAACADHGYQPTTPLDPAALAGAVVDVVLTRR